MMPLLEKFLALTLLVTTVLAQLVHISPNHLGLDKRHHKLHSGCKHSHDCHHIQVHGARPKCHNGKCTFGKCHIPAVRPWPCDSHRIHIQNAFLVAVISSAKMERIA